MKKVIESEKSLERRLCDAVKARGGKCIKFYSSYNRGVPDRLIMMPDGKAYFAELKSTGKKPTTLQIKFIDDARALGFPVAVIDSTTKLTIFLQSL